VRRLITGSILTLAVLALSAAIVPLAKANRSDDARTSSTSTEEPILADRAGLSKGNRGQPQLPAQEGTTAYIGMSIETLSPEAALDLGIDGGVKVRRGVEDGPSAGILEEGDVTTAIGEQAVKTAREVIQIVQASEPGDVLKFTVLRGEDTLDLDVTVGERQVHVRRHIARSRVWAPGPIDPLSRLLPNFVRFEVVVETEQGFKTFQGVRGVASNVDVDAGTFTLTPKDGSEPIDYEISSTTRVAIGHGNNLGGLGTERETLVLSDGDTVLYVLQGQQLAGGPLGSFFGGPKSGKRPGIQGFFGGRLHGNPRSLAPRLFEERAFDFQSLADRLPDDLRDLLNNIPFDLDDLDRLRDTESEPASQ